MYSDASDFSGAQVFTGLRFTFGTGGAIALTYRSGSSWVTTSLTNSTFSSATVYTIEIVGNNKTSGTISYTYNSVPQTVAVQKFDLYINGVRIGDDLAEAAFPVNSSVVSGTFIGISSTSNVANIFVDDAQVYNSVPASIGGGGPPTVTTAAVSAISSITATGNGSIIGTGGANATARGICWDVYSNPDPTIASNHSTESGSFGTGAFTGAITGISAETRYKAVAYATNPTGTGYGAAVNFWTLSLEPFSYSSTFSNSVLSQTQIDLSFDAASTITNADGYIILRKVGSAPVSVPGDGISYTIGTTIGDATVAAIVASSSATSASITSLSAGTIYYFTIIPYNYNGVNNETYNYKTDGTIPSTNGTTLAPFAVNSEVAGPLLGSQPNPVLLSSLITSDASAVRVFDMDIYDYGIDGQPTKLTQVTIKAGSGNTANWLNSIQGVKLSLDGGTSFVNIGAPTITASSIVIPVTAGNLNIPDNSALTLSLYVYLKNSGLTDNQILVFKIDAAAASHGFIADATGSTFLTTFASAPVSNQMLIDVVASKLKFGQQPTNTAPNVTMTPSVTIEATDANNNRDLDYVATINLTSSGTLSVSPITVTPVNGLGVFSSIVHTATGNNLQLTAASGSLTGTSSNLFAISSLLLVEDFSYSTGTLLTANGWTAHSGGGTSAITVTAPAITYPGYLSSGIGNEISLTTSGEDDNRTFSPQSNGVVYISFLVNVSSATTSGDYFFNLGQTSIGTTFRGRVFVKKDASGNLAFGIAQSTTAPNYSSFSYAQNITYLFVIKYNIVTGSTNDISSLYINPALNAIEPPSGWLVNADAAGTDLTELGSVALRQGGSSTSPILKIDGIRVATTWADIVGAVSTATTFTGAGNWTDAGKWNNGIPTLNANAIVDGTVIIDGMAEAKDLTINSGKSVSIDAGKSLTVNGTLTNSAGNAGLMVNSNATGSGSLILRTPGIAGTIQRYISQWTDDNHGWHFLSSPVSGQAIDGYFTNTLPAIYDFYCWHEPSNLWVNFKNTSIEPTWNTANVTTSFTVGKGYLVAYSLDDTKQFAGTINCSDVSISGLSNTPAAYSGDITPGWNLLGNPFTSAVTWNTAGWSLTNVSSTAKIWKESDAAYVDISATLPSPASPVIPAMQGFMVEVTPSTTGSLVIPTVARVHSTIPWYKESSSPYIKLVAHNFIAQTSQESVVTFNNQATPGYSPEFDSHFLPGYAPQFYSLDGTEKLSTNVLPSLDNQTTIPFNFIKTAGDNFTIEAARIENVPAQLYLTDLKLNKTQNLVENPVYAFTSADGDDPARFVLSFSHVGIGETTQTNSSIYAYDNNLYLVSPGNARLEVYDLTGRKLLAEEINSTGLYKASLSVPTGYYVVRLTTGTKVAVTKVFIRS